MRARSSLQVLWPAFVMAGALEMLVFAVVDPLDLRWFGGPWVDASRPAIYTVSFLVFWSLIATAAAITALLRQDTGERDHEPF